MKPTPPKPGSRAVAEHSLWIHSTRLQLELYTLLLIATPFIMLRTYLQQAVTKLSRWSVPLGSLELPVVLTFVLVCAAFILLLTYRRLTIWKVAAGFFVIGMDYLAQQITDFYSAHRFYDLQQNWHYFAYGVFAYMIYRDRAPKGKPLARIILTSFVFAFVASAFDEWFQRYTNNRVFDISDIARTCTAAWRE